MGRRYLQKIVQIQFDLPPVNPNDLRTLFAGEPKERQPSPPIFKRIVERSVDWFYDLPEVIVVLLFIGLPLAAFAAAVVAVAKLWSLLSWWSIPLFAMAAGGIVVGSTLPPVRARRAALRRRQEATRRLDEEIRRLKLGSAGVDVVRLKQELLKSETAKQEGTELALERFLRFVTDDSVLRQEAESEILNYLPAAPRSAKRMINHLRLLLVIASERGMLGGTPPLEAVHLGKWAVLLERWPELGWATHIDTSVIIRLEAAAREGNPRRLQEVVQEVAPQVVASPDLAAFLKDDPSLGPFIERLIYCLPALPTG